MRVALFGPPGSGKGTQGTYLAERFGVPRLAPGDILRENRRLGTPLGRQAEGYMAKGELVPDELIIDLVKDRLAQPDAAKGFLMDGFPRTIAQAEALDSILADRGQRLDHVIYLRVSEAEVVRRLGTRFTCPLCQRVYSADVPSRVEGVCDEDGTALVQREDDRPEAVRNRNQVYLRETLPVLDYYRPRGVHPTDQALTPPGGLRGEPRSRGARLVVEVDGERPVEVIRGELVELLGGGPSARPFEVMAASGVPAGPEPLGKRA
ncbi:MAG TPA: adenylate kinase [Candidatus Dormibacteraeota bacterium]|jgi:adenylate kinase|nr:adenylate kinase [Candidatus Dormibacteraeota bacterium]